MPPKIEGIKPQQEVLKPNLIKPEVAKPKTTDVNFLPAADKNLFLRQNSLTADAFKLNLFAKLDAGGGGGTTPAVDPKKVDDAVRSIKDHLSEGFTDWDVTHGDLESIQRTFQGLNAAEANQVFDRLSDGDLNKWTDELSGINGGYSREEKQQLFNELAGKLSGANLARLAKTLGNDGFEAGDLGRAIGQNASSGARADFVANMAGSVEKSRGASEAVAEVIAGLQNNPAALDRALGSLSDSQMQKLMENISVRGTSTATPFGGAYTIEYKGELLGKMLDAVAKSNDPNVKARVFNAAALQLKSIENAPNLMPATAIIGKGDAAAKIRDSLTNVLNSDVTGIMTSLEHSYRNGEGIAAYAKSMLAGGKTAELGQIIAKLSKGNDLKGDPLARFGTQVRGTDGNPHYQNAQVLGYFAGALFAGAKSITGDRSKQADMLKNVFGTIAGGVGALNPPAGIASSVVNGLTQTVVNQVTDAVNSGTMDMQEALQKLIFPRNVNTGELYEGAAEADFDSAFSRVVIRNQ